MANAPSTQGRNEDGAKATESQHREVKHEANETGSGKVEVKETVKSVSYSKKKVDDRGEK